MHVPTSFTLIIILSDNSAYDNGSVILVLCWDKRLTSLCKTL
jgi:hypothetical protein